jgi:hypothetical protein
MINNESGEWVTDLGAMACRNHTWKITVTFEKQGEGIFGKISEIPDNLVKKWISSQNGYKIVKKIVKEAEEVFSMAYFGKELEKCCKYTVV